MYLKPTNPMAWVFALRGAGKGVTNVRQPANAASTGVQSPPQTA